MQATPKDLDEMIVHEKMQAAWESQTEAWAEGRADGIEPEIIAEAAICFAMQETIRVLGEDGAEALLESLKERIASGEFSPNRTIQ